MKKKIIYELKALYRDSLRVTGYEFLGEKPSDKKSDSKKGKSKKNKKKNKDANIDSNGFENSVCIVGSIRGNEIQQIYTCSQVVKALKKIEEKGNIKEGKKILVIPSINPYSINIQNRFWPTDNTDINRMFPGYNLGETTQRIAGGVFEHIKDYKYGIQFASFYMPGNFMPHVRMMKTGWEDVDLAKKFGLPFVVLRKVRPYDTTTLNYNWQVWETDAFSIYTTSTATIDENSSRDAVNSILTFLENEGIIEYRHSGIAYNSLVVDDNKMISVRAKKAGIFRCLTKVGREVSKGDILAEIIDPLEGEVIDTIKSPDNGIVFFAHSEPMTYTHTAVFKIVKQ